MQSKDKNDYSGTSELEESSKYLVKYNDHITQLMIRGILNTDLANQKICEFGAGTGTIADNFEKLTGQKPFCVEIDPNLVGKLKNRNFVVMTSISSFKFDFDAVYTSNVLEHIEDDELALREIHRSLVTNGKIGIYVPALQLLFSDLDKKVGHYRRYSKRELESKVERAGFSVIESRYVDSLGVLAALVTKLLGYQNKLRLGNRESLILYDKWLFPISSFLDKLFFSRVIGKNLFLIGEKSE